MDNLMTSCIFFCNRYDLKFSEYIGIKKWTKRCISFVGLRYGNRHNFVKLLVFFIINYDEVSFKNVRLKKTFVTFTYFDQR